MVRRLVVVAAVAVSLVALPSALYGSVALKSGSATGEWSGTWKRTSSPPTTGTMTVTFTQNGTKVSGTEEVKGSACLTTHDVKGTAKSGKVAWAVSATGIKANYSGTISGNKLSGKLTVTCSGATGVGTFALTKA